MRPRITATESTGCFGEHVTWFRFHTFVARSHAGDFDAVHLDYGHDGNPPVVRKVKDEVRVAPGLYLVPTCR